MCYTVFQKSTLSISLQRIRDLLLQYLRTMAGEKVDSTFNPPEDAAFSSQERTSLQPLNLHKEVEMPTDLQSGDVPTRTCDQGAWFHENRGTFITQRLQDLVLAFHDRAQKVKEHITQPPTPSPTPPLGNGNKPAERPAGNRNRLESLIHQEDVPSEVIWRDEYVNLWCCKIQRKFIPTFPKVLDPQSKLYISWLFFVMVSYVYNAWVIILRAVFPYQTVDNLPIFLVFDYISDIIYVVDIALFKVRLQFLHDGFWVDDPEKTRKNYFQKAMFKMDLMALLPLDLLYFVYGTNPLFRLPRLLKTQTFWEFFHRVDAVAKTPYVIRIIRTLLYMMYLIHLNACAYYAMSTWEGIGSNGWVFQGEGNAYIRCFYFATKTATSIGKNPKPENEYEYVFMTVSWLMGVFIFAFLIGQIRDIVATATQSKTQYRQLMDQTVMYMRNLNLPEDLQRRVRLWLNHTWEQQKTLNEGGILDSLPRKMKTDVAINVHYNTLVKVQLFKDCDKALLRDLVLQLKPVLFLPGDFICRKGEVGKEMYIVNKGLVQVTGGDNGELVLATLSEGSVFGEISLLGIAGCSRRTADVRSQGFSNLFVLSKDDLWEALKNYPEAQKVLRKKAKSLIKENEARDRASRNNNDSRTIIGREISKPSTPQLMKAVIQVVPKDSKCAQMLIRKTSEKCKSQSKLPEVEQVLPTEKPLTMKQIINFNSITKNNTNKMTAQIFSPQLDKRKVVPESKPRSMSATTLRYTSPTPSCINIAKSLKPSVVDIPQKVSPPPTNHEHQLQEESQLKKVVPEAKDIIKTILNLIPGELHVKRQNIIHPTKAEQDTVDGKPKPNTNSEDSGISIDLKTNFLIQPSQKMEDESYSTGDSEDSSELSTTRTATETSEIKVGKRGNNGADWKSRSPSVLSLHSLFRTSSSRSSSNPTKDASPTQRDDTSDPFTRPESITSGSSSAGYDNLAFVPVDILYSRRSSMFSDDTSC